MPGLHSKAFTINDAQRQAVNFYVWNDEDGRLNFVGIDARPDIAFDLDVAGLKRALADHASYLQVFKPARFEGRDELNLTYTIGTGMTLSLTNSRWLTIFATTNLFCHSSTAYDILRARGVQIGKADLFAGGL